MWPAGNVSPETSFTRINTLESLETTVSIEDEDMRTSPKPNLKTRHFFGSLTIDEPLLEMHSTLFNLPNSDVSSVKVSNTSVSRLVIS